MNPRTSSVRRGRVLVRSSIAVALLAPCGTMSGCAYTLHGRVVAGDMGSVMFVPAGDQQSIGEPVAGASIAIFRDADGMKPTPAGRATSGPDGSFTLVVDGFGAGWMIEEWMIQASRRGVGNAVWMGALPGSPGNQLAIVMLAPGAPASPTGAGYTAGNAKLIGDDLIREVEQYR